MDVNNSSAAAAASAIPAMDIEESLLQQFSCMGTSDRDELVKQLQSVVGNHVSYMAATFFLDMNNWNLQAAICSYFDVEANSKLPSMCILNNPVASEYEIIEPNVKFEKGWQIQNNGTETWPVGCYLQCSSGNKLGTHPIEVPALQPGEGINLVVPMQSPSVPGIYQSKWRLCTPAGSFFGDEMWTIITVEEPTTVDLTQRLSHLSAFTNNSNNGAPSNPFSVHFPERTQGDQSTNDSDMTMS